MKQVVEDINHALVAKAHTPMYLMHKYWARKPHNVVREYIERYSKPGEIVLDPFVGSGVTAIEALKAGRKAIAIDLNPISEFITRCTAMPTDLKAFEEAFRQIEKNVKDEINALYETTCRKCGKKALIICTHFENSTPIKIMYHCKHCNSKTSKKPDENDLKLIKKTEKMGIPYWYPTTKLKYNGEDFKEGTHNPQIDSVDKLFTRRNLFALSAIYDQIEKIDNKKIREPMKFAFTSMAHLASIMTPVRPTRQYSSFWPVHRYWVPPVYMESNVWMLFESAARGKQGVVKGKIESNDALEKYKEAKSFDDLNNGANILIKTHNALEITKIIPPNSIDYIFTDPPYGGAVQYFELSTLWTSWLKMDINYNEEITVNAQQGKDFEFYHKMLKAAFREMYQVLKPGKYLTVTFHSTDIKVWNSIVKAVVMSGFDLEKIIYQPPARPSAKGLLQPYGSAVGDYYIRFKKPESERMVNERQMDMETYEREVVFVAKGILEQRGEPTIYQHILNGIMVDLKGGRHAPIGARNIEDILKDHVNTDFELIDIRNEKGTVVGKKWWLKGRDFSNFTTPALSDRVERVVLNVLDKKFKVSFDDILQAVFIEFPNALTPDSQDIKKVLEEYARPTPDGRWMLKPGLTEKERESQHSRMIYILGTLGKKAKFDVWIGSKEQSAIYNKKPLRELCDDIHYMFAAQESVAQDRVKQIDVMWLDSGRILYEFEVENTTGISDAIIRGSNIPESPHLKRFIIIPEERENFLFKKLQEPILQETIKKVKWNFIRYRDLEKLFAESKKIFNPANLDKIARMPRMKNYIQQTTLHEHLEKYYS
ncbi:MAG: DNA methyltransferase [Methanobacteriota archaeon]